MYLDNRVVHIDGGHGQMALLGELVETVDSRHTLLHDPSHVFRGPRELCEKAMSCVSSVVQDHGRLPARSLGRGEGGGGRGEGGGGDSSGGCGHTTMYIKVLNDPIRNSEISHVRINTCTCTCLEYRGFESHPRQLIFLMKSDCLGCAVRVALP